MNNPKEIITGPKEEALRDEVMFWQEQVQRREKDDGLLKDRTQNALGFARQKLATCLANQSNKNLLNKRKQ